ncbi:glycosyltransferase family 2 protein [Rhodobacteraceae bacterium 63075]|nr:glycosyltransferase family 2 protein [Rhodobacteraceae bacterium 63075]
MKEPSLLAIVLNFRTPEMTLKAAEAAREALEGLNAELVIVDNDSADGSFERMSAHVTEQGWNVRVLQAGRNGGYGAGNNIGIIAGLSDGTRPEFYYILNSDAFPARDAVRLLKDYLVANPAVGFAGSFIHGPDGDAHVTAFRFPTALGELEGAARFGPLSRLLRNHIVPLPVPDETVMVDWLAGASMMMRAETLQQIGLFDESFFLYFEETDLCLRAARAGWATVYLRESEVAHIGSVSTGMKSWPRVPGYWLDSRWHYFSKNHSRAYACYATALHLLGGTFYKLRRLIERKPTHATPHFLYDMFSHALRALFVGKTSPDVPQMQAVKGEGS